ncbi:GNAT family N-acetyltransferase [Candidatus Woesebacteria bacterium]|nr:GNAT family N-acetyltransferase [Candidatus Woesebacteria bacterium]
MKESEQIANLISAGGLETDHLLSAEKAWAIENSKGEIIAYAGIERREKNVYLQSLVVDKAYRKNGFGRKLVDMAFEELHSGDTLIALTLFWNNPFYKNCGFTKLNAAEVKKADDVAGRTKHKYCTAWGKKK